MTRDEYLNQPQVVLFVNWLRDLIIAGDGSFVQRYQPAKGGPTFDIQRFVAAYDNYYFAGKGLEDTEVVVDGLSLALRAALDAGDESATLSCALRILIWGGVTNDSTVAWLLNTFDAGELVYTLNAATALLVNGVEADAQQFYQQHPYRSDSATTKLFALADQRCAIYDDRVAAGLGWLVVTHAEAHGQQQVSELLHFCVKSGASNPSRGQIRLPVRRPGNGSDHALSNMRFNWILGQLSCDLRVADAFGLPQGPRVIRAIEAALFMIGKRFVSIRMPAPLPPFDIAA